jgi:hypothetical protein
MTKRTFVLSHMEARRNAAAYCLTAPDGQFVRFSDPTRSLEQNAKMHACFGDIAAQAKFMGRVLVVPQWKTLMISGHAVATGLGVDMVPGIEGEFVNIRESSANMSVGRMSSVIEYSLAYGAMNGVTFGSES